MTVDVAVLAGGQATRLHKMWDGPKCLVPVAGRPLLGMLLDHVATLRPRRVILVLGHRSSEVITWLKSDRRQPVGYIVEDQPEGTAPAVRRVLPVLTPPVLVLNGDTLPRFALSALIDYHLGRSGCWATAAVVHDAERWRDVYAGASVLGAEAVAAVAADDRTHDYTAHLVGALRYVVPGFFDVGTPESFRQLEWANANC